MDLSTLFPVNSWLIGSWTVSFQAQLAGFCQQGSERSFTAVGGFERQCVSLSLLRNVVNKVGKYVTLGK